MTTIRKIVTSKVDGNSADTNDTNEIRPFGEIAVYINTEPNPDKLTLMMFDGIRTHLKSMVLAPGRLYGSDADSGDGNNRDTIKLIPDASLSDYTGNDQYLIIDPTGGVPGHIHLRAGGTQDASTADLYLGGEQTFVRVSDTSDDVAIRTGLNSSVENVALDAADAFGPGVWRLFFLDADYPNLGTTVQVGDTFTTSWGTPITATITNIVQDIGAGTWALHTNQDITAGVNPGDTVTFNRGPEALLITTRLQKTWTFDNTGNLILPNGGEIRTDGTNIEVGGMTNFNVEAAGVANIYTDDGAYQWQFGDDGALTLPSVGKINNGAYDWTFGTNGSLTFPDGESSIYTLDPATSGGINGIVMNGKDRAYIGIENEAFGYGWDFRAFGLSDYSTTLKPAIKFPGSGWLQEDYTDIMNLNVPLQLGSQGSITLTATLNGGSPTEQNWVFGRDGSLTFPDATVQTTAWAGGRVVAVPTHSTGAEGDLQGDLAFNSTHLYYCIANYNQLGHQVTGSDYLGRASLNTNAFQLTKTADTIQITVGDIISDSDGGATSTVVTVSSDENYTYVGTGGFAYAGVFPFTFTSTDYVSGGNIWKRVAWSGDTW